MYLCYIKLDIYFVFHAAAANTCGRRRGLVIVRREPGRHCAFQVNYHYIGLHICVLHNRGYPEQHRRTNHAVAAHTCRRRRRFLGRRREPGRHGTV